MLSRLAYSFFAVFMLATVLFQDTAVAGKESLSVIPYRTYCEKVGDKFYSRVEVLLHKDLVDLGCSSSSVLDTTHVASNLKGHMLTTWKRDKKLWGNNCYNQPCEVTICGVKYTVLFVRVKGDTAADFCKFKDDFEDSDMDKDDFDWFNVAEALLNNDTGKCNHDDHDHRGEFTYLGFQGSPRSSELEPKDAILATKCVQDKLCDLASEFGVNLPCCQPFFLKDRDPANILADLLTKLADPRLHPKDFSFTGPVKLCCDTECVTLSGTVAPVKDIRLVCGIFTVDLDKDFIACWINTIAPQLGILSASEPRDASSDRDTLSAPRGDIRSQIITAVNNGNLWLTCKSSDALVDDESNPVGVKICYQIHTGVTDANGNRTAGTWAYLGANTNNPALDYYQFNEGDISCGKFCLTLKNENAPIGVL